jgi:hypothetical protein
VPGLPEGALAGVIASVNMGGRWVFFMDEQKGDVFRCRPASIFRKRLLVAIDAADQTRSSFAIVVLLEPIDTCLHNFGEVGADRDLHLAHLELSAVHEDVATQLQGG